jgi:Tfp pilus assembly protein PilN
VQIFNELARQMPEGIYLKSLKQTGSKINLVGFAQSNARVSNLMRNLEASPHLERADLVEVKAAVLNTRRVSEFSLNVNIERAKSPDADVLGKQERPGLEGEAVMGLKDSLKQSAHPRSAVFAAGFQGA